MMTQPLDDADEATDFFFGKTHIRLFSLPPIMRGRGPRLGRASGSVGVQAERTSAQR